MPNINSRLGKVTAVQTIDGNYALGPVKRPEGKEVSHQQWLEAHNSRLTSSAEVAQAWANRMEDRLG